MPIQKGPANLGTGSVDSTELASTLDLSAKTVTYRTIVAGDIASNAITTAKVADTAITPTKMANSGAELGMRNRIINGAMVIDQRNAGASVSIQTTTGYMLDRWTTLVSQNSKFTVQQTPSATETGYATRVGAGFTNYLACTSSSAYSLAAGDYFTIRQAIEGYNIADLAWGTASAQTVTLSFWVRSSLTGTFGGALQNNTSARSYPFTYAISSANTWEQKSVTIAGDTSGTWQTGINTGIFIYFGLGVGSTYSGTAGAWAGTNYVGATGATSVVGTNTATFYITGVQLEKGSTATSFDYRPYGTELQLCQRYYELLSDTGTGTGAFAAVGYGGVSGVSTQQMMFKATKRATPSITINGTWAVTNCGQPTVYGYGTGTVTIAVIVGSTGQFSYGPNTGDDTVTASAEL